MSALRTVGSHQRRNSRLGFLPGGGFPGGGLPGGGFNFSPGSFNFGSSRFEIQPGGTFDFGRNFSFGQDILGQLPTSLTASELPSFSQEDYPGQRGENVEWTDLVKQLLKLGPAYIEAFRKGEIEAPRSAPPEARSASRSERMAALRRTMAQLEQESNQSKNNALAGINPTTAVLGAGVAASIIIALQN